MRNEKRTRHQYRDINVHLRQNRGVSRDRFGRSVTATRFMSAQGGLVEFCIRRKCMWLYELILLISKICPTIKWNILTMLCYQGHHPKSRVNDEVVLETANGYWSSWTLRIVCPVWNKIQLVLERLWALSFSVLLYYGKVLCFGLAGQCLADGGHLHLHRYGWWPWNRQEVHQKVVSVTGEWPDGSGSFVT